MPPTTSTPEAPSTPERQWISTAQLQRRWGINRKKLRTLRDRPDFPAALNLGPSSIRYRLDQIEAWEDAGGLTGDAPEIVPVDVLGLPRKTGPRNRKA